MNTLFNKNGIFNAKIKLLLLFMNFELKKIRNNSEAHLYFLIKITIIYLNSCLKNNVF